MPSVKYPYIEKESKILGKVLRPLIRIEIFSKTKNDWEVIDNVLADTGADLTLIPRYFGEGLVEDITKGNYVEIKGVVPTSVLIAFVHTFKIKTANKEFEAKVAIADSNDVPPIFGRRNALDLFNIEFQKGKEIIFSY